MVLILISVFRNYLIFKNCLIKTIKRLSLLIKEKTNGKQKKICETVEYLKRLTKMQKNPNQITPTK